MCVSVCAHVCVCAVFNECFLLTLLLSLFPNTYTHTHVRARTININDRKAVLWPLLGNPVPELGQALLPFLPKVICSSRVFAVSSSLWPPQSVSDSLAVQLASTSHNKQILMGSRSPALRFPSSAALVASAKLPSSRVPLSPADTAKAGLSRWGTWSLDLGAGP